MTVPTKDEPDLGNALIKILVGSSMSLFIAEVTLLSLFMCGIPSIVEVSWLIFVHVINATMSIMNTKESKCLQDVNKYSTFNIILDIQPFSLLLQLVWLNL